jgi:hypothetical protein
LNFINLFIYWKITNKFSYTPYYNIKYIITSSLLIDIYFFCLFLNLVFKLIYKNFMLKALRHSLRSLNHIEMERYLIRPWAKSYIEYYRKHLGDYVTKTSIFDFDYKDNKVFLNIKCILLLLINSSLWQSLPSGLIILWE